jgi:alpha-tubulin suppressor-like RCC1 family protein
MPAESPTLYAKWKIDFSFIYFGPASSFNLSSTGGVFSWGYNLDGQLGDSTNVNKNTPTNISANFALLTEDKIIQIDSEFDRTAAVSLNGKVFMWGSNTNGQLGDGSNEQKNIPFDITSNFDLLTDDKIIAVSLGRLASYALSEKGRLFSWGQNEFGQLGDGTKIGKNLPTEITVNFNLFNGDKVVQLSARNDRASALSLNGRVFTWGMGSYRELGLGSNINQTDFPTEITSSFPNGIDDKIILLSMGGNHSSALSMLGRVFVWGSHEYGQIGSGLPNRVGNSITVESTPKEITHSFLLQENEYIISISMGGSHSSALSSIGRVFTWGRNEEGQLGIGGKINRNVPIEINSLSNLQNEDKIISISMGGGYSAAVSLKGRFFTWGKNNYGQLGNGTFTNISVPFEHN